MNSVSAAPPGPLASASRIAFEAAKSRLRSRLPDQGVFWLDQQSTIFDVQHAVACAQADYEKKGKGRARQLLSDFSGVVTHYGRIMDVLVSHHAEYVSLAWGVTKLIFVVSTFTEK
jgi:hypothetical protein